MSLACVGRCNSIFRIEKNFLPWNLVLDTIRLAMKKEKKRVAAELKLHSGQGFQYTYQEYFNLTQSYGITPPMSREGKPHNNAMFAALLSCRQQCHHHTGPESWTDTIHTPLV